MNTVKDTLPKKLLLFSFERCGSTTLLNLLREIFQKDLIHEPFNKYHEGFFEHTQTHGLAASLEKIKNQSYGLKHVQGQLSMEENLKLLSDPDFFVIFLYRKNSYARVLSLLLSKQTKIWHKNRREVSALKKEPLDIDLIQKKITSYEKAVTTYRDFLKKNKKSFIEVSYEDLYAPERSLEEKVSLLKKIASSLKKSPEDFCLTQKATKFLSPAKKYTTQKIYRQIPNIHQIEEIFEKTYPPILENSFWNFLRRFLD